MQAVVLPLEKSTMWAVIGRLAVKLALYALNHPDQVKSVVDAVKAAKQPE